MTDPKGGRERGALISSQEHLWAAFAARPEVRVGFLLAGYAFYLSSNWSWIAPGAWGWLSWVVHPRISGNLLAVQGLVPGCAVLAILFVGSYTLAEITLSGQRLVGGGLLKPVTAAALTFIIPGYIGLLMAATGSLYQPIALGFLAALLLTSAAFLVHRAVRRRPARRGSAANSSTGAQPLPVDPAQQVSLDLPSERGLGTPFWCLIGVMGLLGFLHALLFPITEWDALSYHAALGRIFYEYRPTPPLLAGYTNLEFTANWPVLFPSIGAFFYIAMDTFEDFFLRLVSPAMYVITILTAYYLGLQAANVRAARVAALLVAATPYVFVYAVWATGYMAMTATTTLALAYLHLWWKDRSLRHLFVAGVFAGAGAAVSYQGLLLAPYIALVAILVAWRSRQKLSGPICLTAGLLLAGLPWYVRNLLLLGNPFFPFAADWFPSPFLPEDGYRSIVAELDAYLKSQWGNPASRLVLLFEQIKTVLFTAEYLPTTSLAVIFALGAAIRSRHPLVLLLAGWWVWLTGAALSSGAWALRYLLPMIPAAAVLTGCWLTQVSPFGRPNRASRFTGGAVYVLLLAIAFAPGLVVAATGPNPSAFVLALRDPAAFTAVWSHVGQTTERLRAVYGSEVDAWAWLNAHVGPGDTVATRDDRVYYLRDPLMTFQILGREGRPAMEASTAESALAFLVEQHVRFVLETSRHPLVSRLPFGAYLGTDLFPILQVFPTTDRDFTHVYGVGASTAPPLLRVFDYGDPMNDTTLVKAGSTSARLYMATPRQGYYTLDITYVDAGAPTPLQFNRWTGAEWQYSALTIPRSNSGGLRTCSLRFRSDAREALFGLYVQQADFQLRSVSATFGGGQLPTEHEASPACHA